MHLYYVHDDYIDMLRKADKEVLENKNETRPYVGIALSIGDIDYYIPMSSPKPKHDHMKNSIDFMKISNGQRKLGVLNLSRMIPVYADVLDLIDINNHPDSAYRKLLRNQLQWIQKHDQKIQSNAIKLYQILTKDEANLHDHEHRLKERCCDICLLEATMKEYQRLNSPQRTTIQP